MAHKGKYVIKEAFTGERLLAPHIEDMPGSRTVKPEKVGLLEKALKAHDDFIKRRAEKRLEKERREAEKKRSIKEETKGKMGAVKERKKMLEGIE